MDMSRHSRSIVAGVLGLLAVPVVFGVLGGLPAQDFDLPPVQREDVVDTNREVSRIVDRAEEFIATENYAEAVVLLQRAMDQPEDFLSSTDQESLKRRALRIFSELPREGRRQYELQFGDAARLLLAQSERQGDVETLEEVVRRFFYTASGLEAAYRLGSLHLDRGRPLAAARLFDDLRARTVEVRQWEPQLSIKSALSWFQAGRPALARSILERTADVDGNIRFSAGGRPATAEVTALLEQWNNARVDVDSLADGWSMPGGDARHAAVAEPAFPTGPLDWTYDLFAFADEFGDDALLNGLRDVAARLQQEEVGTDEVAVFASQPVAAGGNVIFRTPAGLTGISMETGEHRWDSVLADETLDRLVAPSELAATDREHIFRQNRDIFLAHRIWQDATSAALTTDGKRVFTVEPSDLFSKGRFGAMPVGRFEGSFWSNRLLAYEAEGGRLLWEVGGDRNDFRLPLAGTLFLGPPLPLDDKLYVIVEVGGEIRLQVLAAEDARPLWSQRLEPTLGDRSSYDDWITRGLMPAAHEGLVICPTGQGSLIAVDIARRIVPWRFRIDQQFEREMTPQERLMALMNSRRRTRSKGGSWRDETPRIADGHVVLPLADTDELVCLRLADGEEVWRRPRGDAVLVIGTVASQVLLQERTGVSNIDLRTGALRWSTPCPFPVGRGVIDSERLMVPLSDGTIMSLNVQDGKSPAASLLPGRMPPGNLFVAGRRLMSVSSTDLASFLPLPRLEQQIAMTFDDESQRVKALFWRGQLRLHQGKVAAAEQDLATAVELGAGDEVRTTLRHALLRGLREDFSNYVDRIDVIRSLVSRPEERVAVDRVLVDGWIADGEFAKAFDLLTRTFDAAPAVDGMERLATNHAAERESWIAERTSRLYAAATPEARHELGAVLTARVADVLDAETTDWEHMAAITKVFNGWPEIVPLQLRHLRAPDEILGPAGRERLALKWRSSADERLSAASVAMLARLWVERGYVAEAATLLEELRTRWSDQPCEDGMVGRELASELLRQVLSPAELLTAGQWPSEHIERKPAGAGEYQQSYNRQRFALPSLPGADTALGDWTFWLDRSRRRLHAEDGFGRERWVANVNPDSGSSGFHSAPSMFGNFVQSHGHLAVVTIGSRFHVLDLLTNPDSPDLLWRDGDQDDSQGFPKFDSEGESTLPKINADFRGIPSDEGPKIAEANLLAISAEAVFYRRGRTVYAADALTGRPLWKRADLDPGHAEIVGDALSVISESRTHVRVLSATDGSLRADFRIPSPVEWVKIANGVVVTRSSFGTKFEFRAIRSDTGEEAWTRSFPYGTVAALVGRDRIAFAEPAGKYSVFDVADGSPLFDSRLEADPQRNILIVREHDDLHIVISSSSLRNGLDGVTTGATGGFNNLPIEGHVYRLDPADGTLIWKREVTKLQYDPYQPPRLPVLVFGARWTAPLAGPGGGFPRPTVQRLLVLDLRDGQALYEDNAVNEAYFGYQIAADPSARVIEVDFGNERMSFRFSNTPPALEP